MEMVELAEISYWNMFLTKYGLFWQREQFLGKKDPMLHYSSKWHQWFAINIFHALCVYML